MEQNGAQITQSMESAFSILQLLSDEQIQVQGPDEAGGYTLHSTEGELPEGAPELLEVLEGLDSLRVPAERLGKDLRRFLKDRDLTGGGMLLLAGLRLFFIRQEGPDAYGLLIDRRFQETVPVPEVRLERLIAALRAIDGQKGLFHAVIRRIYRAVEIPGILLENVRPVPLAPFETRGLSVEGKVFVLAGGLTREERARARELIAAQGGRCATSLSGKTDYLAAGAVEKLRENTLLQFRALQSKGREIHLLNTASLFALLGEAPQEDGNLTETPLAAPIEIGSGTARRSIPENSAAEPIPSAPEEPAAPSPISANPTVDSAPAAIPEPMPETAAAEGPAASSELVPDAPATAAADTNLRAEPELPDGPAETENLAAEAMRSTLEQVWEDAWAATMESARAAEARAIAETNAQIQQLQETLAAKERHLQSLGLWKFSERAATRQELQRLNQALRTAEARLSRLTADMERTAT